MKSRIVRAALRVVPPEWRPTVEDDVMEAASTRDRGPAWVAWQAARVGARMRLASTVDNARFDIGYALRTLARARWFTAAAVLIFALGIGINIAVFSAVDRSLFRELPYDNPDDIVVMREVDGSGRAFGTLPAAIVVEARRHHRGFADLSVSGLFVSSFALAPDPDNAVPLRLTEATHNTLELFGVPVLRGRDFSAGDATGQARLALISFDAWKRRFASAEDIVGRKIYDWPALNPVEIVGVLPEHFIPPSNFLNPLSDGLVLDPNTLTSAPPNDRSFPPYVRLRPGTSIEAAQAELSVLVDAVRRNLPEPANAPATFIQLVPLTSVLFDRYVDYLWLIVVAASLVLAVACANLGSLMLVRNRSREHLAATQIALGAPSWRLVRAGLMESMLLSFAGTAVSLLVINWSDTALRAVLPPVFSRYAAGIADARVLTFALLTAALCTLVAGAYPSWRISRVDVLPVLQGGEKASRARRLFGGRTLLVVEAALSVLLVAGAAMTVRSFATLARTDLGFEPDNLHSVLVGWPRGVEPGTRFQQSLLVMQALSSVPGVASAAAADINSLGSGAVAMGPLGPGLQGSGRWRVTSGFFETMHMRLVAGRPPSAAEVAADAPVGVLSESGLRLVWPGLRASEAIGRALRFPGEPDREIVGVVSDVRPSHAATPTPSLYLPLNAHDFRRAEFIIRLAPGASPVAADIRSRILQAGVQATSVTFGDVSQRLRSGLADQRFRAVLFSLFGVTALLLAAFGLYAVGAYEVTRREREMGIRLAIGSSGSSVQWLIMRQTLAPVLVGLVPGLFATYWAASFVQAFLYQVDARDLTTLTIVVIVLLASTALAAWLPAHRAARLDLATVLRAQ
jgi:predicted permease